MSMLQQPAHEHNTSVKLQSQKEMHCAPCALCQSCQPSRLLPFMHLAFSATHIASIASNVDTFATTNKEQCSPDQVSCLLKVHCLRRSCVIAVRPQHELAQPHAPLTVLQGLQIQGGCELPCWQAWSCKLWGNMTMPQLPADAVIVDFLVPCVLNKPHSLTAGD